ncbi:MAG: hypothetical protein EXR24_04370 [Ignavibacteria bacterium]|nr:hypothetical protein [Ignavibacteria bacterium]
MKTATKQPRLLDEVFSKGKNIKEKNISFYTIQKKEVVFNKYNLITIVPKKRIPRAVDRNYIKRVFKSEYQSCGIIKNKLISVFIYNGTPVKKITKKNKLDILKETKNLLKTALATNE